MRARSRLLMPFFPALASTWARSAGTWPDRPVRLIIPFPAGGSTDAQGRLIGQRLSEMWGQPVVIDNRPGAGAVVATNAVAKSPADGYTLGIVVSSHAINPTLRPDLPYDTLKDLQPVSEIGVQHIILDANPALPVRSISELIDLARREPGRLSYASPGIGTAHHLVMELLKAKARIDIVHVPYRGGAPAQQDVIGGQVPLLMDTLYASASLLASGKLKALALFSPARAASAPTIPLVIETVPGVSALSSVGLVAPARTPMEVVEKVSQDIHLATHTPDFAARLLDMGLDPVGSTPQEFDRRIRADILKWAPIIKASGATAN